ncbi:MAG: hypothetical protein HUJ68_13090, partial [Clostridia bacterium]|nr:hypothetical protein [Clostridia bacterium]
MKNLEKINSLYAAFENRQLNFKIEEEKFNNSFVGKFYNKKFPKFFQDLTTILIFMTILADITYLIYYSF